MNNLNEIKVVDFKDEYAEDLSNIIKRNLLEVNIKDYSKEEMEDAARIFTPEFLIKEAKNRKIYVALEGETVVGTAGIQEAWSKKEGEYWILTVFVLPEFHRKGAGKLLIRRIEKYAKEINAKQLIIPSSITSSEFYEKLGYEYKDGLKVLDKDRHYIMKKNL